MSEVTDVQFRTVKRKDGSTTLQSRQRKTGGYWEWDNPRGEYWTKWEDVPTVEESE